MRLRLSTPLLLLCLAFLVAPRCVHAKEDELFEDEDEEEGEDMHLDTCADEHDNCSHWASTGECEENPKYMLTHCRLSCKNCYGERDSPIASHYTKPKDKGRDLGVPQQLIFPDGTREQDIYWLINKARNYMKNIVSEDFGEELVDMCRNTHEHCAWWALIGECKNNPKYMLKNCAPVCSSCEYFTLQGRCPLDPEAIDAWGPGDVNRLFEKLTSEPYKAKYDVEIMSSPKTTNGPWVITMENVISALEATRLIELGHELGYKRSTDVGTLKPDGTYTKKVSDGRTSMNAWCDSICLDDEYSQAVIARLEEISGIPATNSEHLQLLRYEKGQYYNVHHDYIPHHIDKQPGVRLLTIFLYLNDVTEGGGTNFDQLNITVTPKRGRAVVWPSVLDHDPNQKDFRTTHQALPVLEGVKYGANAWLHQRDFKTPNLNRCV